jgi:hypothetical protein
MRLRLLLCLSMLIIAISACQGPPPTVIYIVISPTPETTEVVEAASAPTTTATGETVESPSATAAPQETATPTDLPTDTPLPPTQGPTELPPGFPTPVRQSIQVAEQLFEHGRMFWLQPTMQIWVLKITIEGHGTWEIYEDTFKDGDPENDPSLVPPDGRYQPQRGFGKLWRESGNLRQELGWGVTPEFGYVSPYEYHAGGTFDANGNYVPGPGYHIIYSLGGELFRFNEADRTWQLGNN